MKRKSNLYDIEARIEAARSEVSSAEASIPLLEAERTAAIRSGTDAEIDAAEDRLRLAKRSIERGSAKLEVAQADFDAEQRRLAAQGQKDLEAKAEAAARKAAELLAAAFETIAPIIRNALRAGAEADVLVERANKGIAEDSAPLLSVEARCRQRPALPRKIIKEDRVSEWTFAETGQRLSQDQQSRVVSRDEMSGSLTPEGFGNPSKVVKREFWKRTFLPALRYGVADELASTLSIPSLKAGDAPVWTPLSYVTPEAVLAALDRLETVQENGDQRSPEIEFVPITSGAEQAA